MQKAYSPSIWKELYAFLLVNLFVFVDQSNCFIEFFLNLCIWFVCDQADKPCNKQTQEESRNDFIDTADEIRCFSSSRILGNCTDQIPYDDRYSTDDHSG